MHKMGKTFIISGPVRRGKEHGAPGAVRRAGPGSVFLRFRHHPQAPARVRGTACTTTSSTRISFRNMIAEDAFLEYAEYVGNFYGTPMRLGGRGHGAGEGRAAGHRDTGRACRCAPSGRRRCASSLRRPAGQELERRLTARGTDSPEKVQKRLLRAQGGAGNGQGPMTTSW